MTDEFILTVEYKGERKDFPARLLLQGYSHKFSVIVNDTEVFFEPDEEGRYRMVRMPGQDEKDLQKIDKQLINGIKEKIEAILA